MALADDVKFLVAKFEGIEKVGKFGIEAQLRRFRRAAHQVAYQGDKRTGTDDVRCSNLVSEIGVLNHRADELMDKFWRWHERHRSAEKAADAIKKFIFRNKAVKQLEQLVSEYERMVLQVTAAGTASHAYPKERATYPADSQLVSSFVGRDEDVKNIFLLIDQLSQQEDDDQQHKLHIIPIVGMPGIGKTTVAQMVYAHSRVLDSFDLQIWVHVSPACFDAKVVLRRMANAVASSSDEHNISVEDVEKLLMEKMKGGRRRRYLLVLDDVWNEDALEWGALVEGLLKVSGGARGTVVVTTPRRGAAEMMMAGNSSVGGRHELQGLSRDACWQLFRQSLGEEKLAALELPSAAIGVAELVHRKCCGVPVAAVELARRINDLEHPSSDAFSSLEPWDLITPLLAEGGSLSLSYQLLPVYLRNGFRLCSLFPEDHNCDLEELSDMICALDHLPLRYLYNYQEQWSQVRHDIKLWEECYFHKSDHSKDDKVTYYYKMPNLMRLSAVHLNTESRILYQAQAPAPAPAPAERGGPSPKIDPQRCLHLSLVVDTATSAFPTFLFSFKKLRTLILLRETRTAPSNSCRCKISAIPRRLLASLESLCVLDLQYTMIKRLPRAVGNLLSLRYLNLSGTDIVAVPKSVGRLRRLTYLKLVNCRHLRKLNDAVGNLDELQKLDLAGCLFLVRMPDSILRMTRLECLNVKDCSSLNQMPRIKRPFLLNTLPRYIVGEEDEATNEDLGRLHLLEGELRIENLDKTRDAFDVHSRGPNQMMKLESLTLQWQRIHALEERGIKTIEGVLLGLQPNTNLVKLEIIRYMGKTFPSWMSSTEPHLTSLEEIRLFNLNGCQTLPPLGVLPRLRIVEISGMDAVTKVDEEFYGGPAGTAFPCLQKLTFSQMMKLERWLDANGRTDMFPRLTNLTVINCPRLVSLEMQLPSVTELTMWLNNEALCSSKGGLKGLAGSLKKLSIAFCGNLLESSECDGLQELPVLEKLEIFGCQEPTRLPRCIELLTSLRSLSINGRKIPSFRKSIPDDL